MSRRFTLAVGGRPRSTSEADRDDAGDGEMETDDGPGIPWNVSCRPIGNLPEAPLQIGRSDDAETRSSRSRATSSSAKLNIYNTITDDEINS